MRARGRKVVWRNAFEKAAWLDAAARIDALHPSIQAIARRFSHLPPVQRALEIHRAVRDGVRYQRDPNHGTRRGEEFAHALLVALSEHDDCDGKARLFVALCNAAGLNARIRPIANADGAFVHVQGEVELDGRWVVAELILEGVELGQGTEAAQRGPDGRAVYAGARR